MMKFCRKCMTEKSAGDFYKNQRKCKACSKNYAEKYKGQKKERDKIYYKEHLLKCRSTTAGRMKNLASSVRYRSRVSGSYTDITAELLHVLLIEQNFCCKQTGIKLDFSLGKGINRILCGPSIDRKNPKKGYTIDNIQIVCLFYNLAKNNSSDEEIWSLMRMAVKNKS